MSEDHKRVDYAAKFAEVQDAEEVVVEEAPPTFIEAVPDPVPEVELEVMVAESRNLNLRSIPSTDGEIVAALPRATVVTLIEEVDDVWYGVSLADGTLGYVMRKFVAELPGAYPGR